MIVTGIALFALAQTSTPPVQQPKLSRVIRCGSGGLLMELKHAVMGDGLIVVGKATDILRQAFTPGHQPPYQHTVFEFTVERVVKPDGHRHGSTIKVRQEQGYLP